MNKNKYFILFPVPEPWLTKICGLIDKVVIHTGGGPLYEKLIPHMTFHRPVTGIDEEVMKNLVHSIALQMHQTTISVDYISSFGKEYIVLPVQATMGAASIRVGIHNILSKVPEYGHDPYDAQNTLHITLAEHTTPIFDAVWPKVLELPIESMSIPVEVISLYGKPEGGKWIEIVSYPIPR
jgi:2'-5' RNA ligase